MCWIKHIVREVVAMVKTITLLKNQEYGWCQNIKNLESSFLSLDFSHVYREYNKKTYGLSNEALSMESGLLQFTKICEGEIVGNGSMKLFYFELDLLSLTSLMFIFSRVT